MDSSVNPLRLRGAVRRRLRAGRRDRLGLCGVCRRPVQAGDGHLWIRGQVVHRTCAAPASEDA